MNLTLIGGADIAFRTDLWKEVGGHLVNKLDNGGEREGVLHIGVGESHVLADHQSDGQVGGAPRGGKECTVGSPQAFGLTQNRKVRKLQIQSRGQSFQGARGGPVLAYLGKQKLSLVQIILNYHLIR